MQSLYGWIPPSLIMAICVFSTNFAQRHFCYTCINTIVAEADRLLGTSSADRAAAALPL